MLVYTLGLMGVIAPYATGPGPIWYGSGCIAGKDFWRQGFIMGVVYLVALLLVGLPFVLKFA
jgi:L-tartrate/succinate antiporter